MTVSGDPFAIFEVKHFPRSFSFEKIFPRRSIINSGFCTWNVLNFLDFRALSNNNQSIINSRKWLHVETTEFTG